MGDVYPKFKAAAVQASPVFLNREATVEKACDLIREAGDNGAELMVFPEAYIPAFPHWFKFYTYGEAKNFCVELFKNAIEVPSQATKKLCEAAREADACVVMGINEKDPSTLGTLYNTQLFIDRKGKIMGKHRKLVPTTVERLVHAWGDGSTLQVFETDFGKLGGLICGEHNNSLARFTLLAKGEKIHAASWPALPTKDVQVGRAAVQIRIRYHAYEGKVFVISSMGFFSEEMKETLCNTENRKSMIVDGGGGSSIVGPNSQYLAKPLKDREGIVYAKIDMEEIVELKLKHDVIGHYNRFDIFTLYVNERKNKSLMQTG